VTAEAGIPGELKKALAQRPAAQAAWEKLPPSHKAEFIRWITEAKAADARMRRVTQTVSKLSG
jgi:uncharacterized protein YdeI (YjbR/CyaY-like superfamily)